MLTRGRALRAHQEDESVSAAFDRVGARGWALATWILEDERLASQVLVAAFAKAWREAKSGCQYDASMLCDVRRRSLDAAVGLVTPPTEPEATVDTSPLSVRDAITGFPEPQRAIFELALFGRLKVSAIAEALELSSSEVTAWISGAMRTLQPLLSQTVCAAKPVCARKAQRPQPAAFPTHPPTASF